MGSWDLFNYSSDPPQPEKWLWIQMTWMPEDPTEPVTWEYELETFTDVGIGETWWREAAGWIDESSWGEWFEGPVSEYPGGWGEWDESWWAEGTWFVWDGEITFWQEDIYWEEAGWHSAMTYDAYYGGEIVPFEDIDLGDGWTLSKFLIVADVFNPDVEFLGLFPSLPIALDEIVIDTICIPEPITISLLGLGGLLLIRRRKR